MIEIDNAIISSEELTEKIRHKVVEKNIPQEKRKFAGKGISNIDFYELHRNIESLRDNVMALNGMWIIIDAPIVSSKKYIAKQVVFVKRIIRRCLRWLLRPYFEQITNFNGAVTKAVSDTMKIQEELLEALESMAVQEDDR